MFSSLFLLLLASTRIIASPLSVLHDLTTTESVTLETSSLSRRAIDPAGCPGHQKIYSALMSLANPTALCASLLQTKTVSLTARPPDKGVNTGTLKTTSTDVVIVTSTITSINVITRTAANPSGMGVARATRTMWTTVIIETPGPIPSSCIAGISALPDRKRSLDVANSASLTTSPAPAIVPPLINAARPSALQAFAIKNILAGCSCLSLPIPTVTIIATASSPTVPNMVETLVVTRSKIITSTIILTSTAVNFVGGSNPHLETTTLLLTTTTTIPYATPSLFYLLTSPLNAYISANTGGYDLVLSSIATIPKDPSSPAIPSPPLPNQQPPSCPSSSNTNYTTPTGSTYTIQCSLDHFGSDLASSATTSFEACLTLCARTNACLAVSYVPSTTICYLKSSVPASSQPNSLVWSAVLISSSSSNTNAIANNAPLTPACPNCPNGILPGLQPASPATRWTFNASTGALMIADAMGEEYAGYTLSDFDDGEEFYQQDLIGTERGVVGGAECCYVGRGGLLECAYGGEAVGGDGSDGEVIWAVCYAGAVFHGTRSGLRKYEAAVGVWVEQGQGRSPGCVVVDVRVVPAPV